MASLLQISDTHFGTERPPVVEALVRFAREQAPALVVLSGDITQRARRAQFDAASAFVARLAVPVCLAIPGNHDIPLFNLAARCFWPYAGQRRAFGPQLEPSFESADWLVLALNTTRVRRHQDGELSAAQIERVAQRLARAAAGQRRVVVVHQPVAVTRPEDEKNLLHGHAAAVERWAAAGADLVLGGHIHLPFVVALHERRPALARRLWAVQAGTAVSARLRREAGNSVNLVRPHGDAAARGCRVERWDYAEAAGAFQLAAVHELLCDLRPGRADGR